MQCKVVVQVRFQMVCCLHRAVREGAEMDLELEIVEALVGHKFLRPRLPGVLGEDVPRKGNPVFDAEAFRQFLVSRI